MKNVEPNLGSGMSDDTDHLLSIERAPAFAQQIAPGPQARPRKRECRH